MNPELDWFIFGDTYPTGLKFPTNVKFIEFTKAQFLEVSNNKLGLSIKDIQPYKLCDYRPMYGLIFSEYFKDYTYWGYCDLDLICGNVYGFLKSEIENKTPKILTSGHCSLYLNTPEMNTLFKKETPNLLDWKLILKNPTNYIFDETPGIGKIAKYYGIKTCLDVVYLDITQYSRKMKVVHSENFKHQCFIWNKGKIFQYYYDESTTKIGFKEFGYIHFQKRQMKKHTDNYNNIFAITPTGFIALPNDFEINRNEILRLNNSSVFGEANQFYRNTKRYLKKKYLK